MESYIFTRFLFLCQPLINYELELFRKHIGAGEYWNPVAEGVVMGYEVRLQPRGFEWIRHVRP